MRFLSILIAFFCVIGFMSGCQPTPEENIVIQPLDAEKIPTAEPEAPEASVSYQVVDRWVETFKPYDFITCSIDAAIEMPDTNTYPTILVQSAQLNLADFQTFEHVLAPEATGVRIDTPTKEELMTQLANVQKGMVQYDPQGKPYWTSYKGQEEDIQRLKEEIDAALPETYDDPAQMEFIWPGAYCYQMPDGSKCRIRGSDESINYSNHGGMIQTESIVISGGYPGEPEGTTLQNVQLSQEAAVSIANETLQELNITNLGLAEIEKARIIMNYTYEVISEGWYLIFTRNDGNRFPTYYGKYYTNLLSFDTERFSAPLMNEQLRLFVDETGIRELSWLNPLEIVSIPAENSILMPFAQVQERVKQALKIGLAWINEDKQNSDWAEKFTIHSMKLSNSIVPVLDHTEHGLIVPTWVIEYSNEFFLEKGSANSVLCINAIDGSFVDPNYAYFAE